MSITTIICALKSNNLLSEHNGILTIDTGCIPNKEIALIQMHLASLLHDIQTNSYLKISMSVK